MVTPVSIESVAGLIHGAFSTSAGVTLYPKHVCGNHPLTFLFRQVLHQFHNRLSTLTESCQNKWTTLVIIYEEMVKSSFYIFEDTSIYLRAMVSSLNVAHESRVIFR